MRRALLVGINGYASSPLTEPVEDVRRLASILSSHEDGDPNYECKKLEGHSADNPVVTEGKLRATLREFFSRDAESALFFYSGHGAEDNLGGYLVTQKATRDEPGIAFSEVIASANQSDIPNITIILDCCHSGHMGNWPLEGFTEQIPVAMVREGISILASSGPDESAQEQKGNGGLFTSIICEALAGGAADVLGEVTVASLYNFADQLLGAWDQRPIYKSHLNKVEPLRLCEPKVDKKILRKLTTYFKRSADARHKLDPSYESNRVPSEEYPLNAPKEAIFDDLQIMRSASLVQPDGEKHMYHAAMKNKTCSLTPLGKFYWFLVNKHRI